MMLWIILTAMIVIAAVGLTLPLVLRRNGGGGHGGNIAVLKDQLNELEARVAADAIPPAEAESLRTEIKRRILAEGPESESPARPIGERSLALLAVGLVVIVLFGSTGLYLKLGRPDFAQANASAAAAPTTPGTDSPPPDAEVAGMISQLEAKLKQTPNDAEGWHMLGWSYLQTSRYTDAATAYGRAAALDPKPQYLSAQAEALVQAADGQVTPDARRLFHKAAAANPADARARYYLALDKDQKGDHRGAVADWIALLKSAPADAPWAGEVRAVVLKVAAERGLNVVGQLPPAPPASAAADVSPPPASAPGEPTPDQMASASQMPAGDQQVMIHKMVDGLATRLKANPRDPDGWLRLMRARMVLNQPDAASAAYRDALKTYGDAPQQQAVFKNTALALKIPGA
jgi:cytochrome c-type biogenesis protein CcmH